MIKRISAWSALALMLAAVAAATVAPTSSAQTTPGLNVACANTSCFTQSITGTANGKTYDLTATVSRFVNAHGTLMAVTTVTGTENGNTITPITQQVPVIGAHDPCTILDLTLGPLHLDVLGLVVDLNQVHLTITGQTGNGQLLGNLLCGLANALNGSGGAGGLANILNQLLAGLGL
jgi:hypothetical protein